MGKRINFFGIALGVLSCLFFIAYPALAATRKALLIGVGTYQHLPYINSQGERLDNLKGPGNDVQKIKELLVSGYGFRPEEIQLLKDREATREAVLKAFDQWLIQGTKPGDLAVFYFSGHGTRISRGSQDYYKAICPHDAQMKAKNLASANLIVHEELGSLLGKLKGREVVVIMDSCHSGGMTRSIRGTAVSRLEQTPAIQAKFLPVEIAEVDSVGKTRGKGLPLRSSKKEVGFEGQISILSSREDQVSVELTLPNGIIHGAFTAALLEGIEKKKDIRYGEWFEYARKTIKDRFRLEQDPQLKPDQGKLLSHAVFKPNPADQVSAIAQLSPTEKPPSASSEKPTPSPKPQTTLQPSKPPSPSPGAASVPKPQPSPPPVSPPAPVETKEVRVLVRLDPIPGSKPEGFSILQEKLKEIPYVDLVKVDFFDCLIRGEFKNSQFHLRMITPMGDGEEIPPSGKIEDLIKEISPHLEHTYWLKKLARISNPRSPFKVKVWLKDMDQRDFRVGEKARFYFSSEKDCYLVMLNLDSQGNIHILFPNQYFKDNFIRAKQVVEIPDKKMGKKFELEFGEPVGEEVVKVIATQNPLKLEDLGLAKLDMAGYGPKGLISVPDTRRSILVKKVEEITAGKMVWSEDTIVIRTHKK